MEIKPPRAPENVIFHGSTGIDKIYLVRHAKHRVALVWHTWSNGNWDIDEHKYNSLPHAVIDLCVWLRCNLETL